MNDNQDNITAESEVPDMVNHPPHYTDGPDLGKLECIDITRWMPFALGSATKYIARVGKKGGPEKIREDLGKAEWYISTWNELRPFWDMLYPQGARTAALALLEKAARRDTVSSWKFRAIRFLAACDMASAAMCLEEGRDKFRHTGGVQ